MLDQCIYMPDQHSYILDMHGMPNQHSYMLDQHSYFSIIKHYSEKKIRVRVEGSYDANIQKSVL